MLVTDVLSARGWVEEADTSLWVFPPSAIADAQRFPDTLTATKIGITGRAAVVMLAGFFLGDTVAANPLVDASTALARRTRDDWLVDRLKEIEAWRHGRDLLASAISEPHDVLTGRGWGLPAAGDRTAMDGLLVEPEAEWVYPAPGAVSGPGMVPARVTISFHGIHTTGRGGRGGCALHSPSAPRGPLLPGGQGVRQPRGLLQDIENGHLGLDDLSECGDRTRAGRLCSAARVVEHADGVEERDLAGGVCTADEHELVGKDCFEVAPAVLAHDCGACWSSGTTGPVGT
ncbi:hypothetical protein [Actinokineospora terrae]|uniref:hypothetical protein n=1 Tax=Actinokineospora terrae TaxID=155974 RepID=UPI000B82A0B2|nr:hypothetical protein [Actinokineospora terrae]